MDQLTLYKSSAGSGKTFTLVLEYLKLVLPNPYTYRQVLAVTFTNKATEEMKSRIIETLSALANSEGNELSQQPVYQILSSHFHEGGKEEMDISAQARKVLNLILNDYTSFSVSTIESFFQRIVRAFARELNIPLGYDVEMNQERVLQQLVDEIMLKLGNDRKLTKLMEGFVRQRLSEERNWNVDREIKDLGREIFKEQFQRQEAAVPFQGDRMAATFELAEEVRKIRAAFEGQMQRYADAGIEIMQAHGLTLDDFKYKKTGVPAYFFKVKKGEDYEPGKRAWGGYENPDAWYGKKKEDKAKVEPALYAGLMAALSDILDFYEAESPRYYTALQVSRTLYSFGLLSELENLLQNYRRAHSQLLISDTGGLLSQVLDENADTPFIYEKVGTRFKHYLLDEFQDTSDLQWENLLPLVRDALAQGAGSLIVGDAKQSIYRWRNGNMLLLMYIVEQQILRMGQEVHLKNLEKNFRTAADIVLFNNQFFEESAEILGKLFPEAGEDIFRDAYEKVAQDPQKTSYPGFVELSFILDEKRKGGEGWREKALEKTLETLLKLKNEGFRGGEITLLVRKNSDGVALATFLQQQHIKVLSAESLLLISHPGVRLLTAMLQYLNHENDPIAQASLAYHFALMDHEGGSDHQTFSLREPAEYATQLAARKPFLQQLPVYECVEELIRLLPASLSEPNAYVQGFMDAVLNYATREDASIAGFLEYWEEEQYKKAIAAAPDPDAVQIMTIHKSKGLEFPIVMLPFVDWDMRPSSRGFIWVQPDEAPYDRFPFLPVQPSPALEKTIFAKAYQKEVLDTHLDSLNMLYVAFTRPKYRLYAFAPVPGKSGNLNSVADLMYKVPAAGGREVDGQTERRHKIGTAISRAELMRMQGKKEEEAESATPLVRNMSPQGDWQRAIRIKYQAGQFLDTVERTGRIDRGKLIHEALAYIETRQDLAPALERLRVRGLLTAAELPDMQAQLAEALEIKGVAEWFSGDWEVKNEADLITPKGTLLRPDRVMIKGTEAIVVDYKTGLPAQSHRKQVLGYVDVLNDMGYQAKGYVYYLSPPELIAVS